MDSRRAALIRDIGYEFKYDKPESIRGGAGLIYNKNLKLIGRNDRKLTGSRELNLENIWLETPFPNNKDNYVLGIIYRHLGSSIEGLNDFTKQLETIQKIINNENKMGILTRDLNIDGLKVNKNDHVKAFLIQHWRMILSLLLPYLQE